MDWAAFGTIVAIVLTLMVYSYLAGDNVIFRVAEHLLVGVSLGWMVLQVLYGLILPTFDTVKREINDKTLTGGTVITFIVPFVLGLLLFFRFSPSLRPISKLVMALVMGTVAALALGGVISGTLVPQVGATMVNLQGGDRKTWSDILGNILLVTGAVLSLAYFQFTFRKQSEEAPASVISKPGALVRLLGRWSMMLAFGAIFASVFVSYFAALVDRMIFLLRLGG